jgi:hypothetical protein
MASAMMAAMATQARIHSCNLFHTVPAKLSRVDHPNFISGSTSPPPQSSSFSLSLSFLFYCVRLVSKPENSATSFAEGLAQEEAQDRPNKSNLQSDQTPRTSASRGNCNPACWKRKGAKDHLSKNKRHHNKFYGLTKHTMQECEKFSNLKEEEPASSSSSANQFHDSMQ